jgi:hypothetical protein
MNKYICIGMVSVLALLSGCGRYDCAALESTAKKDAVRVYLKEWVDSRITSGDYTLSEREDLGKVRLPGAYAVNIPLDSKLIEMKEPEARPIVDTSGRAVSFFFGEVTYRGIMIKGEYSENYGFPIGRLKVIDDRTAVLCINH